MMGYIFRILQQMKGLDELSLQSLPVQAAFPLHDPPGAFTLTGVTRAIEKLKLKTLKLALVGTNVWPPANPNHSSQVVSFSLCFLLRVFFKNEVEPGLKLMLTDCDR